MNSRSTDCDACALTTTPLRQLIHYLNYYFFKKLAGVDKAQCFKNRCGVRSFQMVCSLAGDEEPLASIESCLKIFSRWWPSGYTSLPTDDNAHPSTGYDSLTEEGDAELIDTSSITQPSVSYHDNSDEVSLALS